MIGNCELFNENKIEDAFIFVFFLLCAKASSADTENQVAFLLNKKKNKVALNVDFLLYCSALQ